MNYELTDGVQDEPGPDTLSEADRLELDRRLAILEVGKSWEDVEVRILAKLR